MSYSVREQSLQEAERLIVQLREENVAAQKECRLAAQSAFAWNASEAERLRGLLQAARDQVHRSAVLLQAAQVARQREEVDKEHAQMRWHEEELKVKGAQAARHQHEEAEEDAQRLWREGEIKLAAVRAELSATDLRHNAAKQSLQEAERLIVQLREAQEAIIFAPGSNWEASEGTRLRTELQAAQQSLQKAERLIVQLQEELAARSGLKSSVVPVAPNTGRIQCPDCAAARDQLVSVRSQLHLAFAWEASEGARLRTELQKAHAELRKRISPEADSRRSATNCAIISLALQTLRATLSARFGPIPESPEEP